MSIVRVRKPLSALTPLLLGVVVALAACSPTDPQTQVGNNLLEENAMVRAEVPQTTAVQLSAVGRAGELAFSVPSAAQGEGRGLTIGLLLSAANTQELVSQVDALTASALQLQARLYRVEGQSSTDLPLYAQSKSSQAFVTLGAEGDAQTLSLVDVDVSELEAMGMVRADAPYRTLGIAWTDPLPPGNYRLTVDVKQAGAVPTGLDARLLMAHSYLGK